MYKTRFKQWKLDKNLNWQEVMEVIPVLAQMSFSGNLPKSIIVGALLVPISSIHEYLRKRPDGQLSRAPQRVFRGQGLQPASMVHDCPTTRITYAIFSVT